MGKKAVLVDKSMLKVRAGIAADEGQEAAIGEHAFHDKTDWENEDFIFVY